MSVTASPAALLAATEALQATERLYNELKRNPVHQSEVLGRCVEMLDQQRHMKSTLEGSHVDVSPPRLADSDLQELRQLTLMHVPASITDDVRTRFRELIFHLFKGEDVTILYATLITCPWYACTQRERGEQAKHNSIFIVYQSPLRRFISPHSGHLVDQTNVIDKDWLQAAELYHFVQFIVNGRTRNVEALYCPAGAVLYETDDWRRLRGQLHHGKVMGLRNFLEACRGQSVGGIGKKGRDGRFRLKDSTTFRELCDSFRLMHHAYNTVNHLPPCTADPLAGDNCPSEVTRAVALLQSMYQNPDVSKKDAFSLLYSWGEQVKQARTNFTFTSPEDVHRIVGDWHMQMRLEGQPIRPLTCPEDGYSRLVGLMEEIGGPVAQLSPGQVVLVTRAGSYMYNLATPTSDTDYLIVYADNTEKVLSACKRLPESVESRGPTKQIEYGAYEVRCFAEMLMKGSVVILELMFKDDHNYMSPAWHTLAAQRCAFLTERGIQQYMGLIKNNFRMIESGKHRDCPQERKLFYQIYHKLDSLEYFLHGVPPPIRCTGPIRDFILRVRTAPLEGDLHRDELYRDAKAKLDQLRDRLAHRRTRLPENITFDIIVDWIMAVRGLDTT